MIRHLRQLAFLLLVLCASLQQPGGQAMAAGVLFDSRQPGAFLPAEEAFKPSAEIADGRLILHWDVTPGHYLYDRQFRLRWAAPAEQLPTLPAARASLPGEWHDDPTFGRVLIYRDSLDLVLPGPAIRQNGSAMLEVRYQGCAEAGLCYPPQTWQVPVDLAQWSVASAAVATPDGESAGALADWLSRASFAMVLGTFLLLGLGLAFTPCVLPMLPILSAIIAGQSSTGGRRGFLLALSYVLGMSVMYTLAGLLIAGLGAAANLSALLQQPAVLIGFALLFVFLAWALLRGSNLALPAFLMRPLQALQARQQGGAYGSVFVMGAVSSLIVSPCVTAPLAGVMLFLSASQDAVLGGAALFSLSIGMGLPLLLLGAGGGRYLPRSGPWLDAVKRVFAWLLLLVALSLVNRLLPAAVQMLTWAALLGLTAMALLRHDSLRFRLPLGLLALLLLAWSALLIWAGARGQTDPLRPWLALQAAPVDAGAGSSTAYFTRITEPAVLDAAVAEAARQGRPVIIDVYADWCASCIVMEREVLSRPEVRAVLDRGVRLKFDITATTAAQLDWLQKNRLFGPPVFLFWNAAGQAQSPLVGESTREKFISTLEKAWN